MRRRSRGRVTPQMLSLHSIMAQHDMAWELFRHSYGLMKKIVI